MQKSVDGVLGIWTRDRAGGGDGLKAQTNPLSYGGLQFWLTWSTL